MNSKDEITLDEKKEKLNKILNENGDIWKSESQYLTWLRGGIRRIWQKHPVKLKFLSNSCTVVENRNPRSMKRFPQVKRYECSLCKGIFEQNLVEIDHIHGGRNSLKEIGDISDFVFKILFVDSSDLRVVCKECHKIQSYKEKQGIKSFKKAKIEKEIIALGKNDIKIFNRFNVERPSNAKKRREKLREILYKENNLTGGLYD